MEKFNVTEDKFPHILSSDPVVVKIEAKLGNLLEIKRSSDVAGESLYYRLVVES